MNDGFVYAFVDTVLEDGHMIKLYAPLPQLTDIYDMVAKAAKWFKCGNIIEPIRFE